MKLYFGGFFWNANGWVIAQFTDDFIYEHECGTCSKTEIVRSLEEQHSLDEVYIDDILSSKIINADMTKSDFRKLILDNKSDLGRTIRIGDVIFNQGLIYNPRVNNGMSYQYVGNNSDARLVNNLWRYAKKAHVVLCGEDNFYLI